ncbi:MAG TPA: lysine biosynthesis protein LysW [Thermoplasmata archaeon]|nr:lysine biosynthesis protein LysW [Thermoplasmata archaeon]
MTQCPECDAMVGTNDKVLGEVFPCPDCGTELEVLGTDPFQVQPAPKEAEDWGE